MSNDGKFVNAVTGDLISPWHPMTDPRDLKALGKLMEELAECLAASARCVIQGLEESEPVTGKVNRHWLEDEIADVKANIQLVEQRFNLDRAIIKQRAERKYLNLQRWHTGA